MENNTQEYKEYLELLEIIIDKLQYKKEIYEQIIKYFINGTAMKSEAWDIVEYITLPDARTIYSNLDTTLKQFKDVYGKTRNVFEFVEILDIINETYEYNKNLLQKNTEKLSNDIKNITLNNAIELKEISNDKFKQIDTYFNLKETKEELKKALANLNNFK